MEIRTSTFFCEIKASKAFCAPAAPDASSATSSTSCRPSTPPLALISSTASWADWTTDGATTLLAPDRPTGTPILMGSAANAKLDSAAADAVKSNAAESERIGFMTSLLLLVTDSFGGWRDHRSVPTRLRAASEHLVVDVGSTVPQHLVEGIPVSHAPGLTEIDLGKNDLLRVPAGRPGNRPPGVTDDEALPLEGLSSLGPDAIGAGDEHRIAVGGAHREDVGHRLSAFRLSWNRHPVGGHADDVGAL